MSMDPTAIAVQLLNSLQLAMLLFLLSIGLSVIFGLMDYLNLAHGTIYMLGAYFALSITRLTDSFWLALALAPVAATAVGVVLYLVLLKRTQASGHLVQVLVTLGVIYVGLDGIRMLYGNLPYGVPEPAMFTGAFDLFGEPYPAYRIFLIGLGLVVMIALYVGLERTRIGAVVRAGVDDRETVEALGIDIDKVFLAVFCIGTWLAGVAGVVAAPIFGVYPGMDVSVLILMLIVVVVGGLGSLRGVILGSFLIALADTFGKILLPEFAMVIIYCVMAVVLLVRPGGLVPARRFG